MSSKPPGSRRAALLFLVAWMPAALAADTGGSGTLVWTEGGSGWWTVPTDTDTDTDADSDADADADTDAEPTTPGDDPDEGCGCHLGGSPAARPLWHTLVRRR